MQWVPRLWDACQGLRKVSMHSHPRDAFSKAQIQMSVFLFREPSWEDGRLRCRSKRFRDVFGDLPGHLHIDIEFSSVDTQLEL